MSGASIRPGSEDHDVHVAASTSFRDVYVREGSNNYEWHVYHVLGTKLATLPSQKEAAAFMDGYVMGHRHGTFA